MTVTEFDMPEPIKLLVAGDWHGDLRWAKDCIDYAKKHHCDAILQLGDFGFWPRAGHYYDEIYRYLRSPKGEGITLYWIDGNHEDHLVLDANVGTGNESIRHLPRGHRWSWWNKTWMAVGGGVSVDKRWRKEGHDWFPQETLSEDQLAHCLREGDVDIIVSHDCPDGVLIPGVHALDKQGRAPDGGTLSDPPFPVEQIAESEAHRELLGQICRQTKARLVLHGHYHTRYESASNRHLAVIGLDKNRSSIAENTLVMTAESVPW